MSSEPAARGASPAPSPLAGGAAVAVLGPAAYALGTGSVLAVLSAEAAALSIGLAVVVGCVLHMAPLVGLRILWVASLVLWIVRGSGAAVPGDLGSSAGLLGLRYHLQEPFAYWTGVLLPVFVVTQFHGLLRNNGANGTVTQESSLLVTAAWVALALLNNEFRSAPFYGEPVATSPGMASIIGLCLLAGPLVIGLFSLSRLGRTPAPARG